MWCSHAGFLVLMLISIVPCYSVFKLSRILNLFPCLIICELILTLDVVKDIRTRWKNCFKLKIRTNVWCQISYFAIHFSSCFYILSYSFFMTWFYTLKPFSLSYFSFILPLFCFLQTVWIDTCAKELLLKGIFRIYYMGEMV